MKTLLRSVKLPLSVFTLGAILAVTTTAGLQMGKPVPMSASLVATSGQVGSVGNRSGTASPAAGFFSLHDIPAFIPMAGALLLVVGANFIRPQGKSSGSN